MRKHPCAFSNCKNHGLDDCPCTSTCILQVRLYKKIPIKLHLHCLYYNNCTALAQAQNNAMKFAFMKTFSYLKITKFAPKENRTDHRHFDFIPLCFPSNLMRKLHKNSKLFLADNFFIIRFKHRQKCLLCKLTFKNLSIQPIFRKELFVRAALGDKPFFEHKDAICGQNRR